MRKFFFGLQLRKSVNYQKIIYYGSIVYYIGSNAVKFLFIEHDQIKYFFEKFNFGAEMGFIQYKTIWYSDSSLRF